jgi:molybdopterin-containing oxidoreductase family molybdopterin binding subunit
MLQDKAVDPPFEAKSDHEIAGLLAEELGLGEYFKMSEEEIIAFMVNADSLEVHGITYDSLKDKKVQRYIPAGSVRYKDFFYTPSGRMELYVENPTSRVPVENPVDLTNERLPYFRPPIEAWSESEAAKKYPLVCIQEHTRFRVHAQWFNVPWLRELDPEPTVKMNPVDAEARGIKTGDYVRVFNDRGEVVVKAIVCGDPRPGMVNIPKGWQRYQFKKGGYQELTQLELNPSSVNQSFFDVAVEVEPWNGA